jgi:predicted DNA-binding transcriptional regulator YafY
VIDRLERLLNLVIALRETPRPLLAAEIRERVAGYGQPDAEAFRRMFERDKADLRSLGVPIEARPRMDERTGYRIDPADYDLPPLRLEPAELTALALALAATGLVDDAGAGLAKLGVDAALADGTGDALASVAGVPRGPAPLGLDLDAPHRRELMEAQLTRTPVRFPYRPPGREVGERTVDPHALVHRRGRWYLVGHDHRRGARRAFRLDRIAGRVRAAGEPGAFPAAEDVGVDDVVPPLPAGGPEQAEVAAAPAIGWQVARRALGGGRPLPGPGDRTLFTVAVGDPQAFVSWALEYGPELEVLSPPSLRAQLVERLRAAAGADR